MAVVVMHRMLVVVVPLLGLMRVKVVSLQGVTRLGVLVAVVSVEMP